VETEKPRRRRSAIRMLWILFWALWVLTALAQLGEALLRVLKAWRTLAVFEEFSRRGSGGCHTIFATTPFPSHHRRNSSFRSAHSRPML
jgi:hypothetical protein